MGSSNEPTLLTESEIETAVERLPGWIVKDKSLVRVEKFPTYRDALECVYRVGLAAEENDHHPDISMSFKEVTFVYSTHSAGGITDLDLKMAAVVEGWIRRYSSQASVRS